MRSARGVNSTNTAVRRRFLPLRWAMKDDVNAHERDRPEFQALAGYLARVYPTVSYDEIRALLRVEYGCLAGGDPKCVERAVLESSSAILSERAARHAAHPLSHTTLDRLLVSGALFPLTLEDEH